MLVHSDSYLAHVRFRDQDLNQTLEEIMRHVREAQRLLRKLEFGPPIEIVLAADEETASGD